MAATDGNLGDHAPLPCRVSVWLPDPSVVKFDYDAPWEDYAYPLDQTVAREIIDWSGQLDDMRSRIEEAEDRGTYTAEMQDFDDECQDLYDTGAMLAEKAADMLKQVSKWATSHPGRSCLVSSGSEA